MVSRQPGKGRRCSTHICPSARMPAKTYGGQALQQLMVEADGALGRRWLEVWGVDVIQSFAMFRCAVYVIAAPLTSIQISVRTP